MKITKPTLIVNKEIALRNIKKMIQKAERNNVTLRPHFKTHQSIEVGNWFRELGVKAITVSSVRMAKCFADNNWEDITIAFPVNILEIEDINYLNNKINLNLLVDSLETVNFLKRKIEQPTKIWIDIDVGYHRDGISWNNKNDVLQLASAIKNSANLELIGILTHAGHSYKSKSTKEILEIHTQTISSMLVVKQHLVDNGFSKIKISIGDTPTASIAEDFSNVDEIRPGNFVFYDLKQIIIGSCKTEDVAVRLACPVVAKYKDRNEVLIAGGAIHFSKDFIIDQKGIPIFGYLCDQIEDFWWKPIQGAFLFSISQEHGVLKVEDSLFEKIKIGDVVYILPVHSCLVFNTMGDFQLISGEEYPISCK